ncbi:hypothetical protein [Desulfoscipio gibsoniae]
MNLATGEILIYNLSPEDAVKSAYLQFSMKNFNTWDYDKREVALVFGNNTVACGDLLH